MLVDVEIKGGNGKATKGSLNGKAYSFPGDISEGSVATPTNPRLEGGACAKVGSRQQAIQCLAAECSRVQEDHSYQFSVLMVQFHGLAQVAHRLGDAFKYDAMAAVSNALLTGLGAEDLCCRLGSDEFLLIFPGKGKTECRDIVDRLGRRCVPELGTRGLDMAVSIGFASSPAQGNTAQALFAAADLAMLEHGVAIIASVPAGQQATVGIGLLAVRPLAVAAA